MISRQPYTSAARHHSRLSPQSLVSSVNASRRLFAVCRLCCDWFSSVISLQFFFFYINFNSAFLICLLCMYYLYRYLFLFLTLFSLFITFTLLFFWFTLFLFFYSFFLPNASLRSRYVARIYLCVFHHCVLAYLNAILIFLHICATLITFPRHIPKFLLQPFFITIILRLLIMKTSVICIIICTAIITLTIGT